MIEAAEVNALERGQPYGFFYNIGATFPPAFDGMFKLVDNLEDLFPTVNSTCSGARRATLFPSFRRDSFASMIGW
jgi:hypothetical protein